MSILRVQPRLPVATSPQGGAPARASESIGPLDSFEAQPAQRIPAGPPTLQRGSVGGAVTLLQQKLVARGYLTHAEMATGRGVFGPRTEAAVRRLQEASGLPLTGVVGPSTFAALRSDRGNAAARWAAKAAAEVAANDTLTDEVTQVGA